MTAATAEQGRVVGVLPEGTMAADVATIHTICEAEQATGDSPPDPLQARRDEKRA
jgi:hypothetical protein